MNSDEKLVGAWLVDQGHAVRHMVNGEDPPDLVVDDRIAVEVTTIASHAFWSIWDFVDSVCRSLGPAEDGRGYFIAVNCDNRSLLQNGDRRRIAKIKRELKFLIKIALGNHYRNPDAEVIGSVRPPDFLPRNGRIRLTHGVELTIVAPMQENRDNVKYEVGMGGTHSVWAVSHLVDTIQAAIERKTNNRLIQERADTFDGWWLVVTDPQYSATHDEAQTIAGAIKYGDPWKRILLAGTHRDSINAVHCLACNGH